MPSIIFNFFYFSSSALSVSVSVSVSLPFPLSDDLFSSSPTGKDDDDDDLFSEKPLPPPLVAKKPVKKREEEEKEEEPKVEPVKPSAMRSSKLPTLMVSQQVYMYIYCTHQFANHQKIYNSPNFVPPKYDTCAFIIIVLTCCVND